MGAPCCSGGVGAKPSLMLDGISYNPQDPMQVGQVVALSEVTVEVTEIACPR